MRMFWQTRDYGWMALLGASLGGFRMGMSRPKTTRRGRYAELTVKAKAEMKAKMREAWPELLRRDSPGRLTRMRTRRRRRVT